MSALNSMSIRQTLFRMHWVLYTSDRHCFVCTAFFMHPTDIVSCAVSSVSIRQIFFRVQWVLCPSNRHCFVCAEFYVHQTDIVSFAVSSVSIRQTWFRVKWVLCPSYGHCFVCSEFCVHQTDIVSCAVSSLPFRHVVSYPLRSLSFRKILIPTRMTWHDSLRNEEWNVTSLSPGVFSRVVTKEIKELACSEFKWN
jgi:hypothetical protein